MTDKYEEVSSELLYHTGCIECNSSDAMAVYRKTSDSGEHTMDAWCFSCNKYFNPEQVETVSSLWQIL